MRYRAGAIGGTLSIQKEAGGGTTILCSVHQSAEGLANDPGRATKKGD